MYILDSDVLTVVDGSRRNANVQVWFDSLDETDIYISVIAVCEKSKNANTLAKRGDARGAAQAEQTLKTLKTAFAGGILVLDADAAEDWGRMLGKKDKHLMDTATAAIAKKAGFIVATRNAPDYVGRGATVIDPFKKPAVITTPR